MEKTIEDNVRNLLNKEPKLQGGESTILFVWRYWEVYHNNGILLVYITKKQFQNWQEETGRVEKILEVRDKVLAEKKRQPN
jgi:hypothetical protein